MRLEKNENRKKYTRLAGAALFLTAALAGIIGGSFLWKKKAPDSDAVYWKASELAEQLKEKYGDDSPWAYTYGEPIEGLARGQAIQVHMAYDPYALTETKNWGEFYQIFQNPDLTGEVVGSSYDWDAASGTLSIAPPDWAPACVSTLGLPTDMVNRYPHSAHILFDFGAAGSWGNLGTLYLACYRDAETGEKLDRPRVSVVTLKAELDGVPRLQYRITQDGRPEFSWTPVEGAETYLLCEMEWTRETGYGHLMYPLGTTADTTWTAPETAVQIQETANPLFRTFSISEDDKKGGQADDSDPDGYKDRETEEETESAVCVIAVNGEGLSLASNAVLFRDLAPNLPYRLAAYAEKENGVCTVYESVEDFPGYDYVTMCDGLTRQKRIDYLTEEASVLPERIGYSDEEGNYLGGRTYDCLTVPYVVEGTPFSYTMKIENYSAKRLQEDMRFLEEREEQLRKKAGALRLNDLSGTQADTGEETDETVRLVEGAEIFADSALGEYLAANLLSGVENIDLSAFLEADDLALTEDVFLEAYYQNPLILGIRGYQINGSHKRIRVGYENDSAALFQKQKELLQKADEIISGVLTPAMTETEKVIALNQYLCDTVSYDRETFDRAKENGLSGADSAPSDSFSAYGALMNGRCGCSGYAAAFQLLADRAGLESIVVTGILEGGPAHAWNKVCLDGEWLVVDVTNNDAAYLPNALLNLPDDAAAMVLAQDRAFMLDARIGEYVGKGEEKEYYHRMGRFFPQDDIAEPLIRDLLKDGTATLRTGYDLNDEGFGKITGQVYERMGGEEGLYGVYWLGVIYLSL